MPYKNIEDSRANKRRNRAENPEKVYQSNKRSHEKRREKDLEGVRADRRERTKKQRMLRPELTKHYKRKGNLKRNYGLSIEEYDRMLVVQNGSCAICYGVNADGRRLHVDHDHATGGIRALLCSRCNTTLGKVGDRIALLNCMIEYLRDYEVPITEQKVA